MTGPERGNERRLDPACFSLLEDLAPGVWGYTVRTDAALYVPLLLAECEGSGAVGRYLDALPTSETIRFPNVISRRLAGMLRRRGFRLRGEWSPEFQEVVAVWERPAREPGEGEEESE